MNLGNSAVRLASLALFQVLISASTQGGSLAIEHAVLRAKSQLGLVPSQTAISSIEFTAVSEITISDSLARMWTGIDTTLNVYRVVLKDIELKESHYHPRLKKDLLRDFTVYVDSATGVVYRFVSRSNWYDSTVIRKPSPSSSQRRILFKSEPPPVSLLSALDLAAANPFQAMEIDAALVIGRFGSDTLKPVWEIHMYGVEHPGSHRGKDRPIYQRNHCMSIIDARSGEFLLGTN